MNDIVSPYLNISQYTKVLLKPHQMNSDIKNNLKMNLKDKVEKKCNKNGYIDTVYKIEEYGDGLMPPENLSGAAIYPIVYLCRICMPVENTIIIGQVQVINPVLILAKNGPIYIFIPRDNVDSSVFDVTNEFMHSKTKQKLKTNQYVKIHIVNKKINKGDSQINAMGRLLDFASEEEVNKYFGSVIVNNNTLNISEENTESNKEMTAGGSNFII